MNLKISQTEKQQILEMHKSRMGGRKIQESVQVFMVNAKKIDMDLSPYINMTGTWSGGTDGEISIFDSKGEEIVELHGTTYGEQRKKSREAEMEKTNSFKPEEITNFLKNGGTVENFDGKKLSADDKTKGYKFEQVDSKGNVVLRFSSGEGKTLVIDPNSKNYTIFGRSAMTDDYFKEDSGYISFDGNKIVLHTQ